MKLQERKPELDLDRISVAKPCSASWDEMTGDERSRLCAGCERQVYNISALTPMETRDLIASHEGKRLCIRLFKRTDGTVITSDCPKGLAAYRRRVTRFATAAFASILGLFSVSYSQTTFPSDIGSGQRGVTTLMVPLVEGRVIDQNGAVIPNAKVTIKTSTGKKIVKTTDENGRFQFLDSRLIGKNSIKIERDGFNVFVDIFMSTAHERIDYCVRLEVGMLMGDITILPPPQIDMRSSDITTTFRVN
ncbi:MAG TPA: carboxypeptidase-like regulatory domain-containing protein [Pyrinomonadaceae bacterium]|nr:carboxypeptidase-like regulatory domain-containing protein [Pyrinomonadaceae bacterium]